MKIDSRGRMATFQAHKTDVQGQWPALSWEDFKHQIWRKWPDEPERCIHMAAKLSHKVEWERMDRIKQTREATLVQDIHDLFDTTNLTIAEVARRLGQTETFVKDVLNREED